VTTIYDVARVAGVSTDEIDIERHSLLFIDHIVPAAETVLRETELSLLLTFGNRGEQFEKRVRSLAGQADGLLIVEEVLAPGELRTLAGQLPVVLIAGRRDQTAAGVFLTNNVSGMTALARRATHRLLARIADPALALRTEVLPTQLVIRASCGCQPPEITD
jgi:DNA-binding LacI/PurR family transcriptional regulator